MQSQICATATLSTEEPFACAQYVKFSSHISQVGGGGQEIDVQCDTIDGPGWISGPSETYVQSIKQGLQLFRNWERRMKQIFVFIGDTRNNQKHLSERQKENR